MPMIDVLFVVLPHTLLLDLAGPAEALRLANQQLARRGQPPAFALRFVGPQREVVSSIGLGLGPIEPLPEGPLAQPTWVLLMGRPGEAKEVLQTDRKSWLYTRDWLARTLAPALHAPRHGHRLLTVCSGALLAADAGLLAGRQVTTHHEQLDDLARMAPSARVLANRVFVDDGAVSSSAGITAGIDLALDGVARVCGEAIAQAVARVMVVFSRRGSEAPELSPLLAFRDHLHAGLHRVQDAVAEQPAEDWTLARLAELAAVTPRHLGRLFLDQLGTTPRDYVERVRLTIAEQALARGASRQAAADVAGFRSPRQLREALLRGTAGSRSTH